MPCYHPLTALQPTTGGRLIFPKPEHHYLFNDYRTVTVPCGQCSGCRLKRSREWAARCVHEKQLHQFSAFITLTYDDKHLPPDRSFRYRDIQNFLKRLRRLASRNTNRSLLVEREWASPFINALSAKHHCNDLISELLGGIAAKPAITFYLGAEYGEREGRPHYHILLFGAEFADRLYLKRTPSGEKIYVSRTLQQLWPLGFSSTANVTFESAAYVARYVMAKRTGDGNKTHYEIIDPETAEIHTKRKEFNTMSKRPALGSSWMRKYSSDIYTTGKMIMRGHAQYPPRYYDKLYARIDQAGMENFKHGRYMEALLHRDNQTDERLAVQEQVQAARTKTLKRGLT